MKPMSPSQALHAADSFERRFDTTINGLPPEKGQSKRKPAKKEWARYSRLLDLYYGVRVNK